MNRLCEYFPRQLLDRLIFFCLALLLFFAPIIRGGNRQVAIIFMLGIGLLLAASLIGKLVESSATGQRLKSSRWFWAMVLLLAFSPGWLTALQLVPIDPAVWTTLAGRAEYAAASRSLGATVESRLPLSLVPSATIASLWSAVPISAAFLAAFFLKSSAIARLFWVLIGAAILQIVVSIGQLAQGQASILYFDSKFSAYRLIGTFNNRNHLANFLAMMVPLWFYLLAKGTRSLGRVTDAVRPLFFLVGFGLVVTVLATQSRGGILAAMFALLTSTIVYFLHSKSGHGRRPILVITLFGCFILAALLSIGLESASIRFDKDLLKSDAAIRNTYMQSTLQAFGQFWPWGTGAGTFEGSFPRFQAKSSIGYVDYAHNDYAQLLMELGASSLLLIANVTILMLYQLKQIYTTRAVFGNIGTESLLALFALISTSALLLHSWVDFNMHIPALATTAAFLFGVFLRPIDIVNQAA